MCHHASLCAPPSGPHFFLWWGWGRSYFLLRSDRHGWHSAQIPVALPASVSTARGTCWNLLAPATLGAHPVHCPMGQCWELAPLSPVSSASPTSEPWCRG